MMTPEERERFDALLRFAESIANHRSGNLHGFYWKEVEAARRVVKAAGGKLEAVGRYGENETEPRKLTP